MEHKTNKELQEHLSKFPDEAPVGIGVKHDGILEVFHKLTIQCAKKEDLQLVIINSEDIDEEYEAFYEGSEPNEE